LEALDGQTPTGQTDKRVIRIYKDHLARDMENFVSPYPVADCQTNTMPGGSTPLGFVCHDSTTHAYKGETFSTEFWSGWTVKASAVLERNYAGAPDLGTLSRGDVVAYYASTNQFDETTLTHSQICTGNGSDTWGANNKVMTANDGWKFATSTAGALYMNYDYPPAYRTVRVYQKP
jgi:hypothetical protein